MECHSQLGRDPGVAGVSRTLVQSSYNCAMPASLSKGFEHILRHAGVASDELVPFAL